jgi:hypothetical protein
MQRTSFVPAGRVWMAALVVGGSIVGLGGCQQADYGVDITNKTPQPVFAKIFRKGGSNGMLGASARLGPGDRMYLGPVRTEKDYGAFVSVDTQGNPGAPLTADLMPGTAFVEVVQDGQSPNGRLHMVEKK